MRAAFPLFLLLSLVVNLTFASVWLAPATRTSAQADSRYFPETQHTVSGLFLKYWNEHGGLAQQGYPLTEQFQEVNKLDGKTYTVQYFERAIFELHPENAGTPYEVLLSQLGTFELQARYPAGVPLSAPSIDSPRVFSETGHTIGGVFRSYWESHGGLTQQGYPLTEEFQEANKLDGKTYTVQYFERAIFELHPENPPPYNVLLSQLGRFELAARYPAGGTSTPVPPTVVPTLPPTATPVPGYFATASLSDPTPTQHEDETITGVLLRDGQPVAGAKMRTTWHFKSKDSHCDSGITDATGTATCLYNTGGSTLGFTVKIDVQFQDSTGKPLATAQTGFTPH